MFVGIVAVVPVARIPVHAAEELRMIRVGEGSHGSGEMEAQHAFSLGFLNVACEIGALRGNVRVEGTVGEFVRFCGVLDFEQHSEARGVEALRKPMLEAERHGESRRCGNIVGRGYGMLVDRRIREVPSDMRFGYGSGPVAAAKTVECGAIMAASGVEVATLSAQSFRSSYSVICHVQKQHGLARRLFRASGSEAAGSEQNRCA